MGSFDAPVIENPFLEESGFRFQRLPFPDRGVRRSQGAQFCKLRQNDSGTVLPSALRVKKLIAILTYRFNSRKFDALKSGNGASPGNTILLNGAPGIIPYDSCPVCVLLFCGPVGFSARGFRG